LDKFYIQSYGCQMNVYETGVVRRILTDAGFEETTDETAADVLLMMTCSVRGHAEQRAIGRLGTFRALRSQRPGAIVGVLGCMAQRFNESLARDERTDIVVGPDEYRRLPELIRARQGGAGAQVATELGTECYDEVWPQPDNRHTAFVSIMRGCNNYCSYCIVPYVKGRERSKPFEKVIAEIESLAGKGIGDVTLLGQNVLAYRDSGHDFVSLLAAASAAAGPARIRFLTSHPRDLDERLLAAMRDLPNVCPALHLPFQSGSDRVLGLMNRGYTRAEYVKKIEKARRALPDVSLTTDVIVGFPSEAEDDFQDTLALIQEVRFDFAYMFRFSQRPGTAAAKLGPKVSEADAGRRLARLIEVQNRITLERNREMLDREFELLIEGPSPRASGLLGRTRNNKIVIVDGTARAGELVRCRVTHVKGWTPVGRVARPVPVGSS
jgi:tRNA-2-methylthio-N6-dimethylallyladenosine synthase